MNPERSVNEIEVDELIATHAYVSVFVQRLELSELAHHVDRDQPLNLLRWPKLPTCGQSATSRS
jgi:hypothetical protein